MKKFQYLKIKKGQNVNFEKIKNNIKELHKLNNCYYWLIESENKYNILNWKPQCESIEYYNIYLDHINEFKQLKKEYDYLGYKLIPISKIKKYY